MERLGGSFGGARGASLDLGSAPPHSLRACVPWKGGLFLLVKPFLDSLTSLEGLSVAPLLPGSSVTPCSPAKRTHIPSPPPLHLPQGSLVTLK